MSPKRTYLKQGWRKFLMLDRIEEKEEQEEGGNGGVPRDSGGVSARKRAGKEERVGGRLV